MFLRYPVFLVLFLFLFVSVALAQESAAPIDVITIGDTVEITVLSEEQVQFSVDVPFGESFLIRRPAEQQTSTWHTKLYGPDNESVMGYAGRYVIKTPGLHTLEVRNFGDADTDVEFQITNVPTREIDVGERVVLGEDDPQRMEFTFSLDEPQPIVFQAPPNTLVIEKVSEDQIQQLNSPFGYDQYLPVHGELMQPGDYRVFLAQLDMTEHDVMFLDVSRPAILGGALSVGEMASGIADKQPVQYTFSLEADQTLHATVLSRGAHGIILPEDDPGEMVGMFAHTPSYDTTSLTAPTDGTYILHVANSNMMAAMDGPYIILTSTIEIPQLRVSDDPYTFDITPDMTHYLMLNLTFDTTHRVRITTLDGEAIDGALGVDVKILDRDLDEPWSQETLLQREVQDTAETEFTIDKDVTGTKVIALSGLDGLNTTLRVDIEAVSDTTP